MKLLMISGLTALALFLAATSIPRAHPPSVSHTSAAEMPTVQEMQKMAQQSKLPVEDFEDRSLVFPRGTQR
ncbi:hypothetical protein [Bradyrhizobium sp. CB2312]|uniref:hypothetical protein n=1 Tax=Bradyrhizobium sp. CB2312 TaxID=3039155 RepID=UPI0024B1ADFF|nr:hypothetical protein [Bradyrhizobium sp. CB2312]WFU69724.1 hypothetical protein QA642_31185 [Bradyrhizobium sp. CB2312]